MLKKCLAIVGLLSEGWRCNQSSDGGKEMEFHFQSSSTNLALQNSVGILGYDLKSLIF